MGKFSLRADERLLMDGYATYLKSALNVYQGDAYLTSSRFVYCKKNPILFYALAGPIFGHLFKGKTIVFEIELSVIRSLVREKQGFGFKYVITTEHGEQVALGFGTRSQKWIDALRDVVKKARPGITVEEIGESIYFSTE